MKNKVAVFGVFTSLALILSYVELLIPINFGIPGMKLGLANLLVVILLYKGCPRDALLLSVIRILLSGLIFGNMFSIFYSLGGGLLSLAVMVFLKKTGQFTVAGISIGGGASHNVGQLLDIEKLFTGERKYEKKNCSTFNCRSDYRSCYWNFVRRSA